MKLSENFDSSEFKCKCCGELPAHGMDSDLIKLLQDIRDKLGKSISITSGYRCKERNKAVGGAKHSQHVLGAAADITVAGMKAGDVYDFITEHFNDRAKGLGRYKNFTHVDCRNGGLVRWVG